MKPAPQVMSKFITLCRNDAASGTKRSNDAFGETPNAAPETGALPMPDLAAGESFLFFPVF
jgi:hypothetical protein